MMLSVKRALKLQRKPKPSQYEQGTSGCYFLENERKITLAIFKPLDEEPYAPNNPKKKRGALGSIGLREGILSGECASREVFAYLLDYYSGYWHGVPPTTFVEFYHPEFEPYSDEYEFNEYHIPQVEQDYKIDLECESQNPHIKYGSLQAYAKHDDFIGNFGESVFNPSQIRKIAILDLRIMNCDRNEENILVKKLGGKNNYRLIPIDHGFSLPDKIAINDFDIVWYDWKAMQVPFSEEELEFIAKIDPLKDCQVLSSKLKIRTKCLFNFRIAQTFLKLCANMNFTLREIADFVYRIDDEEQSQLEKIIELAIQKTEVKKQILQKQKYHLEIIENNDNLELREDISQIMSCFMWNQEQFTFRHDKSQYSTGISTPIHQKDRLEQEYYKNFQQENSSEKNTPKNKADLINQFQCGKKYIQKFNYQPQDQFGQNFFIHDSDQGNMTKSTRNSINKMNSHNLKNSLLMVNSILENQNQTIEEFKYNIEDENINFIQRSPPTRVSQLLNSSFIINDSVHRNDFKKSLRNNKKTYQQAESYFKSTGIEEKNHSRARSLSAPDLNDDSSEQYIIKEALNPFSYKRKNKKIYKPKVDANYAWDDEQYFETFKFVVEVYLKSEIKAKQNGGTKLRYFSGDI